MRQVRESIEVSRPAEQVPALWRRVGQPGDEVEVEDLGGRTRLTVIRTMPDEGFVERMVDVTFNAEGSELAAELERFRIEVESGVAPRGEREAGR